MVGKLTKEELLELIEHIRNPQHRIPLELQLKSDEGIAHLKEIVGIFYGLFPNGISEAREQLGVEVEE